MENIYFILFIIPIMFIFHLIRFKLTCWEEFTNHFESVKRPELKPIYGFWSELKQSANSYPLNNSLIKVAVTSYGLYLQYDLKFELIKYYKPVIIPWKNISITNNEKSNGKGSDEYLISKNDQRLGSIFLQITISEQITREANSQGVSINFI